MEHEDPGLHEQEEHTDAEEQPVIDAAGRGVAQEITAKDLEHGVELEQDPTEAHKEEHPTPDHPSGRLIP